MTLGSIKDNSRAYPTGLQAVEPRGRASAISLRSLTRRQFAGGLICCLITSHLHAEQRPQRIVSTSPSITEALFALGLGDRVVGVSIYCDFPASVQKLPKVGTYLKPDAEAIARLAPDLVVLQRTSSELTDRLTALRIPFVEVPHGTLEDVFTGVQIIAKGAGIPDRAASLIAQIKSSLAGIQARAKMLPSPSVLVLLNRTQGTLTGMTAVGPDTYLNQILEIAGGRNVLAKPGLPHYPHISMEVVLRENPDVILDLSGTQNSEAEREAARLGTLSLWRQNDQLAAVHQGRVFVGTSNALLVPGPRAPEAAQRMFDYFHETGNHS
jgi:iron complex transport system substrate-binding protein